MIELVSVEDVRSIRGGKGNAGTKYGKYAEAIAPLIPYLKEQISKSKDGIIRIKSKDLGKEMARDFTKRNHTSLYWGLKYTLFGQDIAIGMGTHNDGDKILTMRTRNADDVLSESFSNSRKKPVDFSLKDRDEDKDEDEDGNELK